MRTPSDRLSEINGRINNARVRILAIEARLQKGEWKEEDHPRADDGRFGDKSGEHKGEKKEDSDNGESEKENIKEGSVKIGGTTLNLIDEDGDAIYVESAYKNATGKTLDFDGSHGIDVRYYGANDPMSDYGHAMFVNADKEDRVSNYSRNDNEATRYLYDRSTGTDINNLHDDIVTKWDEAKASENLPPSFNRGPETISGEEAYIKPPTNQPFRGVS